MALGLVLSHPRNTSEWRKTKQVFPWHEMLTVFTFAFIGLHVVLLAVDPFAKVGWLGALVPGFSGYRAPAIAVGTVAMYALLFTAVTAKWTRLLPAGWWLEAHRFAAVAFLFTWAHRVLAGTDGGALHAPVRGDRPADPWRRRPSLVDREGPHPSAQPSRSRRPCPSSGPRRQASRWRSPDVQGDARPARPAGDRARGDCCRHWWAWGGAGRRPVARRRRPARTAPVGMTTISDDYAIETERAADLANQMDGVAGRIRASRPR